MLEVFAPGRVAVITGAASGIGRAVATELAGTGMKIVLVDTNADKMPAAESEVIRAAGDNGQNVMPVICDVAHAADMNDLARDVTERWEAPTFLMNNAAKFVHGSSVGAVGEVDEWRKLFEVNLFGVLNGVSAFAPAMLASGRRGVIVNTGSKQGLTNPPGNPAYNTVKAAVNAYTQNLAHELRNTGAGNVSAHLLVPGWTTTGDNEHKSGAWLPDQVADYMFKRLQDEDFYIICPDGETSSEMDKKRILWQARDMIDNRPALSRWHPDYSAAFAAFMEKPLD